MKRFEDMTLSELMELLQEGTIYSDFLDMLFELRTTDNSIQVNKMFESLTQLLVQETRDSFDRIVRVKNSKLITEMHDAGVRARGGI